MPGIKDLAFSRKKTKSLNMRSELLSRKIQANNNNRNSFTGIVEDAPNGTRKLSRSSSYADNEAVLLNAVGREDVNSVRRVLEQGKVDINVIRNGLAPLHLACINGNMIIVQLLLRYEANIKLKTKDEKTTVKLAALNGNFELAEYLISMGAEDTDIADGLQS